MESLKTSFTDEEEIFYYPSISNFGVHAKNLKPSKNIFMSFSPLSSNQKITFSNTIMIPSILKETSFESKNNNSREKLQFSEDEINNSNNSDNIKKQIKSKKAKISFDGIDENKEKKMCLTSKNKDKEANNTLEKNPYFFGQKYSLDMYENKNNIPKNEEKHIKKVLSLNSRNKKKVISFANNMCLKTSKEVIKNINIEKKEKNLNNNPKRVKSSKLNKLKQIINKDKEPKEVDVRKSQIKFKTFFKRDSNNVNKEKNLDNSDQKIYDKNNDKYNDKNIEKKIHRKSTFFKRRESSVKGTSYNIKINNNINLYKSNLFNKNSSKNIKKRINIKSSKTKNKDDEKKTKKERVPNLKDDSLYRSARKKTNSISFRNISKDKKFKTIKTDKEKNTSLFRKKLSEVKKTLNFEMAMKNKNNLSKTQFNLFSPDKFTNTEFCGSDYLEYTLDCMELVLKSDKSKKQPKNKVNFNFPKTKGNELKKIALFDLDETLVHCTGDINAKKEPYQHSIEIELPGNKKANVGINIRPFWKKTLNLIRKYYHIVVFTASHQAYADAVLDFMDPTNKYFKYRLYRNNCSLVEVDGNKFYVKDLDIFDEYYNLKDIIIIDNSALSFIYHLENGIPIVPYYHEDKDGSLYVVGLYLIHIYKENDLREANKKYINLDSFLNEAKQREAPESTIMEESSTKIIDLNKNLDKSIDNSTNEAFQIEKESIKEASYKKFAEDIGTPKSAYFAFRSNINKLKYSSKLINMLCEMYNNNKYISKNNREIIEEKSGQSFSNDEEEERKKEKTNKNMFKIFGQKGLLTKEDKPIRNHKRTQSNKTLHHYLNTKTIRSNFYQNFSKL